MSLYVPSLDVAGFVYDNVYIGTRIVSQILRGLKHKSLNADCPSKRLASHDVHLEDITNYDDPFYSIEDDKINKMTKLFIGKKVILTCFPLRNSRVQVRTLQQRLADVTTNEVIRNLSDKQYKTIFAAFYKPMDRLLKEYCKLKKLSLERDVVLFYKGGNVFRILLSQIADLLQREDYKALLKRSDADFQIYINPDISDNAQVREEVSLLVLYVLHHLRIFIKASRVTSFKKDSCRNIIREYREELAKNDLLVNGVELEVKRDAMRKDLLIGMGKVAVQDREEYVIVRRFDSLVDGLANSPSTYFISRNTALNFQRKDNLCATFDLLRFRRNFRLKVDVDKLGEVGVNVPFEIIDVSIPHSDDFSLKKLSKGNISTLTKKYVFRPDKGNAFEFRAPTVQYQLKDLHDLLFYQNELPWLDIKYAKRMTRYFLTMLLYDIVEGLTHESPRDVNIILSTILGSFQTLRDYLNACHVKNEGRPLSGLDKTKMKTTYVRALYDEYIMLDKKVQHIERERDNFKKFINTLVDLFDDMIDEVDRLKVGMNANTQTRILQMVERLSLKGQTHIL